jgi:hypothetical protein
MTRNIKLHSLVDLAEPVGGFPAGRRGGIVEEYWDGTLLVELTDDPSLDALERLVTAPPEELRLVRS